MPDLGVHRKPTSKIIKNHLSPYIVDENAQEKRD